MGVLVARYVGGVADEAEVVARKRGLRSCRRPRLLRVRRARRAVADRGHDRSTFRHQRAGAMLVVVGRTATEPVVAVADAHTERAEMYCRRGGNIAA